MTCDQLREEYELYAMGLADEPERSALGAHLEEGCKVCADGVRRAREMVALMATTAPAVAPSPGLRRRLMASVGAEEQRRGWGWSWTPLWAVVSAMCLVAAVYFYGRERDTGLTLARLQEAARAQTMELARLNDALALLNQPETRQVTFGEGAPKPPRGRVFVNPKGGVLLMASNLPAPPEGKTYEMWLIPRTGNPVPAGLFQSDAQGSALHMQRVTVDMASTKAVAVTLEPAGGVQQPTSQPLIVAVL
jgi:anti-sigma-K factor RskA